MPLSPTIDSDNKLSHAQDYGFLSREAISLIQGLSGEIWTDYNTHDPGITLIETLCYALTDLGYRTSFEVKDILAPSRALPNNWEKIFYTARQILPCNPLTLLDYRKLIIDTDGVRNAWIEKSDDYEILMYLQKTEQDKSQQAAYSLTYDPRKGQELLRLRGLYKVFVEYEDNIIKENKEEEVAGIIRKKLQYHRNLTEDFVSVATIEYESFSIDSIIQVSEGTDVEQITARIYKVIHDFFSPPLSFYSLDQMMEKTSSAEEVFKGPVLKYGFLDSEELEKSERYKNVHLSDIIRLISGVPDVIAVKKFTFGKSPSPFSAFTEWINNVKDMQKTPRLDIEKSTINFVRSGDRHRDKEDKQPEKERVAAIFSFLQSADLKSRLKGISKDLPVPKGEFMDIADYYPFQYNLPVIYGMKEKFIDDTLDMVSVSTAIGELLDKKVGIKLRRLFVMLLGDAGPDDAVGKIIEDFFEEPPSNDSQLKEVINRLLKDKGHQTIISDALNELFGEDTQTALKERLNRLIENDPYPVSISEKSKMLAKLAEKTPKKSLLKITRKEDIEHLKDIYKKYQVSRLDKRKQLTIQLKGFLMVFEQIMADHLSQLAHTRELFSFDASVNQTYFPQVLEEINDLETLFIDFDKYKNSQVALLETEDHFVASRNRILDHLMSRFSESMDRYAFFMQNYLGKGAGKKLIKDKIAFLSDYIPLSAYRGKAFDYTHAGNAWGSDNVEGLKKRICRLLGIENYSRRVIAHDSIFIKEISLDENTIGRFVVILADPDDKESVLLESIQFESEGEARQILKYILEEGLNPALYLDEGKKDRWTFQLKRHSQENDFEVIAESLDFQHKDKRDKAFKRTLELLNQFSEDENFHVIEHILLRPKIGPREQLSRRRTTTIDQDVVNLLSIRNLPDKINISNRDEAEEPAYKFNITQHKDAKLEDITIWKVSLLEDEEEVMVVNDDFTFFRHLTRRINHIRELGADVSNYLVETNVDGLFTFKLQGQNVLLAEGKKGFRKKEDLDEQISKLVHFFSFEFTHTVEDTNDNSLSNYADPYSLQVSVILPDWHARFRSPAFMHLLEKTIYLETPSHIHPHIYWLDHKAMKQFEEAYKLWVEELSGSETPDTDIVNNMIGALNELRK
jgi:hypothetical protein